MPPIVAVNATRCPAVSRGNVSRNALASGSEAIPQRPQRPQARRPAASAVRLTPSSQKHEFVCRYPDFTPWATRLDTFLANCQNPQRFDQGFRPGNFRRQSRSRRETDFHASGV